MDRELKRVIERIPVEKLREIVLDSACKDQDLREEIILEYETDSENRELLIEEKIDQYLKEATHWLPRVIVSENESSYDLLDQFGEDEIVSQFTGYEWEVDLENYYHEQFEKTNEELKTILYLIENEFKLTEDADSFFSNIGAIIAVLDEYGDFLVEGPHHYEEILSASILNVLKSLSEDKRGEILRGIAKEYLKPENKDLYTYTMAIVLDILRGRLSFIELHLKRIEMELQEFDLSDYTRDLRKAHYQSLKKEMESLKNS